MLLVLLCHAAVALFVSFQDAPRHPTGVIAGRVVDDEGRPMRGMQVEAFKFDYHNGRRTILPRGNPATSNDRGEFRLFWLEPGDYYVTVNPTPPLDPVRLQTGRFGLGYIPSDPDASFVTTYFPGTSDIREAEQVQVGVGDVDIHSIQVAALPSRLIKIRVVNPKLAENTNYLPMTTVRPLTELTDLSSAALFPNVPRPVARGEFEMRMGLAPGEYRLLLQARSPAASYLGSAALTITASDSAIVDVPVSQTKSVQGQVRIEGSSTASFRVTAVPAASHTSGIPVSAEVRPNGKFLLEDILPGTYALSIDGLEDNSYVSSTTLLGDEVSAASLTIPADVEPLTLTIGVSQDGSIISGVVVDETRTAQAGAIVVLAPDAESPTRLDSFRFAVANAQGEFRVQGVAPGAYTALAFPHIEPDVFRDPEFLNRFATSRIPVTVSKGARLNLGVVQISKP